MEDIDSCNHSWLKTKISIKGGLLWQNSNPMHVLVCEKCGLMRLTGESLAKVRGDV